MKRVNRFLKFGINFSVPIVPFPPATPSDAVGLVPL